MSLPSLVTRAEGREFSAHDSESKKKLPPPKKKEKRKIMEDEGNKMSF